jgi:hypothetical protein
MDKIYISGHGLVNVDGRTWRRLYRSPVSAEQALAQGMATVRDGVFRLDGENDLPTTGGRS